MGKLVSREVAAAELLSVSVETVIRLARSGDLEEIRVSDRAVRVDAANRVPHRIPAPGAPAGRKRRRMSTFDGATAVEPMHCILKPHEDFEGDIPEPATGQVQAFMNAQRAGRHVQQGAGR